MKRNLFVLLAVMLMFSFASADVFNVGKIYKTWAGDRIPTLADIPDTNYVAVFEDYTTVVYKFVVYFDGSDTENYHTPPLYIGDCNAVDGYTYGIMDAAGDVNIIYHFSADDRNNWETTTPAGHDAQSNTAKTDTIGIEAGTNDIKFHNARWLVIEADGQASNDGDVLTFIVKLTKDLSILNDANGSPFYVSDIVRKSNTNP